MGRTSKLDVLLALLGASSDRAVDGATVGHRLELAGHPTKPGALLSRLLTLESTGLVEVQRRDGYRFALTTEGERAAYQLGPGDPVDVVLVMVDLVGFVAFTEAHGDSAAHHAARVLHDVGDHELRRVGGAIVKPLGDGFMGTASRSDAAIDAVRQVAHRCRRPNGEHWPLRASVHRGRPIAFRGDLFGADVNLAARLCEAAAPGELVTTAYPHDPEAQPIKVRGLTDEVAVTRMAVP